MVTRGLADAKALKGIAFTRSQHGETRLEGGASL